MGLPSWNGLPHLIALVSSSGQEGRSSGHPYGLIKEINPVLAEHWSTHFMAVTGVLEGQ
jgi:hypothetical protein